MNRESKPTTRINSAQASLAVTRNTLWNLSGAVLPIIIALITVPILLHSIGTERFGILTIAWVILGYFGLFDLGLGRATIKFLAEAFEQNRVAEGRGLFWTTLILSGLLGLIGSSILAVLAPVLVREVLNISADMQRETLSAFYLLAGAVPLVTLTAALRGTLEAQHRFGLLNALQMPVSVLTQAAPLLALTFSRSLVWLVGALVLARLLGTVVFAIAALRQLENPFAGPFFLHKRLRALFSYGGWLTVTNIVGPLMVYTDRFIVGSLASMSAVAYYTAPYDAVTRLGVLPQSLTRTIFPIFSAEAEDQRRTDLYTNAIKYLSLVLAPMVATLILFAQEILYLWVGEAFADRSTVVLQILAAGIFVNSLAMVPFTLIQGMGRPDITAKLHLLELPFYIFLLWYGVQQGGIIGAAIAWTARVSIDGLLLALYVWLAGRVTLQFSKTRLHEALILALFLIAGGWFLNVLTASFVLKVSVWGLFMALAIFGAWRKLLTPGERKKFTSHRRKILS